jgi:hypothetical protein
VPLVAAAVASVADEGRMVKEHGAPGCVMVNVLPLIVSVPVRGEVVELAATLYVTEPLPVPLAPAPMVIHESLLEAVQPQPLPAVTVIEPLAAIADGNEEPAGAIVTAQGMPACVTEKV